jgi:hypothetical protein
MKRFLFLVSLAMLPTACGAATGVNSTASPSPTPGMGYAATATNSDHAVTLHAGEKLEVVLRAGQGMNSWSHPTSSDPSILEPIVDPAATAAIGVTLAAFQAVKPGVVDVTSNASPKCSPGQACPMYLAVYSLKVTVIA